jgi:hypothetical protein
VSFEPTTQTQQIVLQQTISNIDNLYQFRIERLAGVSMAIPGVFWYVVLIGAAINIILLWMLDMRFLPQLVLGGMIAFFLGVMIFLLIAMDQPLRGAVRIPSSSYELVYHVLMEPDEGA